MFIHFTYCTNMKSFPSKFHILWNKYFAESPINEIRPVLGTRNVDNLQQRLVFNKWFNRCCLPTCFGIATYRFYHSLFAPELISWTWSNICCFPTSFGMATNGSFVYFILVLIGWPMKYTPSSNKNSRNMNHPPLHNLVNQTGVCHLSTFSSFIISLFLSAEFCLPHLHLFLFLYLIVFICTALMSVSYFNKWHETRRLFYLCISFVFNFDKTNRLLKSKSWE